MTACFGRSSNERVSRFCLILLLTLPIACGGSSNSESSSSADAGNGGGSGVGDHARGGTGAAAGSTSSMNLALGGGPSSAAELSAAGAAGESGQGQASALYDYIQLAAGQRHACARLTDGRVKCWGQNGGWLGLEDLEDRGDGPGEMGAALPAVALGQDWMMDRISTRDLSVCGLLHSGAIKCWGVNSAGELGLGDCVPRGGHPGTMGDNLPSVNLGRWATVVEIQMGANHACVRTDQGQVLCWGRNDLGQLGLGDTRTRGDEAGEMGDQLEPVDLGTGRTATQLALGWLHTCALLDDHTVKCWGSSGFGELGLGDVDAHGDEPDELGDALPRVDLGVGQIVRAVYAGEHHNCAILEDRRVRCWGRNDYAQLGTGNRDPRGDSPMQMGDRLPYVDLGAGFPAKELALGAHHTCALSTNGSVKCWGSNGFGQLGIGTTEEHGATTESMGAALPSVDFGGSRRALTIAAGMDFTCATLSDSNVVCWGDNRAGQLGLGNTQSRGSIPSELGAGFLNTLLE